MSQPERKINPRRGCTRQRCFTISFRIGFVLFFLAYISLGAYVFLVFESADSSPPSEEIRIADDPDTGDKLRLQELMTHQLLEKLWDITENLNILYKENWTQLASYEMSKLHSVMLAQVDKKNDCREPSPVMAVSSPPKWNYPMAFLYALSVITTLGSCPVIPASNEGKLLTIVYAAFGIPLLLFYLTIIGSVFTCCLGGRSRRFKTTKPVPPQDRPPSFCIGGERIRSCWPVLFCLAAIVVYIMAGAWLFTLLTGMALMDAIFLSFMLFTTMGIPDSHAFVWSQTNAVLAVSAYIFVGLNLCSLCFNLLYEWLIRRFIARHRRPSAALANP